MIYQINCKKCYVALSNDTIEKDEEYLNLSLQVDLDNYLQQWICYEHSKSTLIEYSVT